MKFIKPLLPLLLLVFLACNSSKKPADDAAVTAVECVPMIEDRAVAAGTSDPYEIKDARISENCLEVDVSYGGGCGEEEFRLVWDGKVKKTDPPGATLKLLFKDEDRCKKLVMTTLRFDISGLQKMATAKKEIKVTLPGHDSVLQYTF